MSPSEHAEKTESETIEGSSYLCRSIFDVSGPSGVNRLWPNGQVLTYRFLDGHPNQHAKVAEVILQWSHHANIIFKLTDDGATPWSSIITISFKETQGCWSYIGTDARNATNSLCTMALGALSDSASTTKIDRALILHQFGHALGLVHEHMCPSETDMVALNQDLIVEYYNSLDNKASIAKHLDIYANESVTNYAAPDMSSVMVYSMSGKFNEGNLTVKTNATLSPLDKAFMAINYPKSRMHYQLRHALFVANVDEDTCHAILEEYDITKQRALFSDYLLATRQRRSATLVDPTPETIMDFALPAVQDALRVFFDNIDNYPGAEKIRVDTELTQELNAVLTSFASYEIVQEVVQGALPPSPPVTPASPGILEVDEGFTDRLVDVVAMLHAALAPRGPGESHGNTGAAQVDAVTALCKELAQHVVFRRAMKRAIGEDTLYQAGAELISSSHGPEGAIIAQLFKRPAVLRAVRQALIGYPGLGDQ